MNLALYFSFYNWDLIQNFILKGLMFSLTLTVIATLGGMEIYGINGFVIGPLIAALFIACWNLLSGREHAGNTDEIDEEFIEEAKNSRNE